ELFAAPGVVVDDVALAPRGEVEHAVIDDPPELPGVAERGGPRAIELDVVDPEVARVAPEVDRPLVVDVDVLRLAPERQAGEAEALAQLEVHDQRDRGAETPRLVDVVDDGGDAHPRSGDDDGLGADRDLRGPGA